MAEIVFFHQLCLLKIEFPQKIIIILINWIIEIRRALERMKGFDPNKILMKSSDCHIFILRVLVLAIHHNSWPPEDYESTLLQGQFYL